MKLNYNIYIHISILNTVCIKQEIDKQGYAHVHCKMTEICNNMKLSLQEQTTNSFSTVY